MVNFWLGSALLLFIIFCCASIFFSVLSFAPWLPSRRRDLARIFKLADLKPGQIFYDLGAGDGRVAVYAAKYYQAKAIGLEISLPLYLVCRIKQVFSKSIRLKFKLKNLYKENLSAADVVFFFSIPNSLNEKFSRKLKTELRPGAKIISYSFKLNGWEPAAVDRPSSKDLPVYLYVC